MAAALWATAKQDSRQDSKIMGTPGRFSNLALPPGLEEQMPGYSVELGDRRQALRPSEAAGGFKFSFKISLKCDKLWKLVYEP